MFYASSQVSTYWTACYSGWTFVYIGLADLPTAADLHWLKSIPDFFVLLVYCAGRFDLQEMMARLTDLLCCTVALWREDTLYFESSEMTFNSTFSPWFVVRFIFDLYEVRTVRGPVISWPDYCDAESEEAVISSMLKRVGKSESTRRLYKKWATRLSSFQNAHSLLSIREIQWLPMCKAEVLLARYWRKTKLNSRQRKETSRMLKKLLMKPDINNK